MCCFDGNLLQNILYGYQMKIMPLKIYDNFFFEYGIKFIIVIIKKFKTSFMLMIIGEILGNIRKYKIFLTLVKTWS